MFMGAFCLIPILLLCGLGIAAVIIAATAGKLKNPINEESRPVDNDEGWTEKDVEDVKAYMEKNA